MRRTRSRMSKKKDRTTPRKIQKADRRSNCCARQGMVGLSPIPGGSNLCGGRYEGVHTY